MAALEVPKNAQDWRFSSPVVSFYEDTFDVLQEIPLGEEFQEFDIAGTTCSIGVLIMRTEDEFIYATTGFGNLVLLEERAQGIPREKRNHGFELVFRLRIPEEEKSNPEGLETPLFPVDMLLQVCASKVKEPMPPIEPHQRLLLEMDVIPEELEEDKDVTTKHFFYAPANTDDDAPWNQVFKDPHGEVRFLFVYGMTPQEKFWAKNHGIPALVPKMREAIKEEIENDEIDCLKFGVNDMRRPSFIQRKSFFST